MRPNFFQIIFIYLFFFFHPFSSKFFALWSDNYHWRYQSIHLLTGYLSIQLRLLLYCYWHCISSKERIRNYLHWYWWARDSWQLFAILVQIFHQVSISHPSVHVRQKQSILTQRRLRGSCLEEGCVALDTKFDIGNLRILMFSRTR